MTSASIPEPAPSPGDPQTAGGSAASVTRAQPPKCPTRTRLYEAGRVVAEGFSAEEIAGALADRPGSSVWLDLYDPDEADLRIVTEEFGLHPLAVEDAIHDHQRPKVDRYKTHLFVNVYATAVRTPTDGPGRPGPTVQASEISAFITPRALITVRKSEFDVDTLVARWDLDDDIDRAHDVARLTYGLLDAVVDGHYAAVEALDDAIDTLEDGLFDPRPDDDTRRGGYVLRRDLAELRRVVAPMHDLVGRLMRADAHLVDDALAPYFQDVYDHVIRATETLDASRDRVTNILDTALNEQGNELNVITRKLAAWAAIIAVPTAVTGFYGQNVPYPGFGHHAGFVTSSLVIVLLAGGLYLLLRRRGWL